MRRKERMRQSAIRQVRRASDGVPIPPVEDLVSVYIHSTVEADWIKAIYGGRRYTEVPTNALPVGEIFWTILAPSGYGYYLATLLMHALENPEEGFHGEIVGAVSRFGDEEPGEDLLEALASLDEPRLAAVEFMLSFFAKYLGNYPNDVQDIREALKTLRKDWLQALNMERKSLLSLFALLTD